MSRRLSLLRQLVQYLDSALELVDFGLHLPQLRGGIFRSPRFKLCYRLICLDTVLTGSRRRGLKFVLFTFRFGHGSLKRKLPRAYRQAPRNERARVLELPPYRSYQSREPYDAFLEILNFRVQEVA